MASNIFGAFEIPKVPRKIFSFCVCLMQLAVVVVVVVVVVVAVVIVLYKRINLKSNSIVFILVITVSLHIYLPIWCFDPIPGHDLPLRGIAFTLSGHTTLGRTPLDEWSARRRGLYVTTHNTHKRETHPCPRRDSNPQSQQANGRRPTP